ncbi:MAG: Yip1 family protein [Alkaliphilus sp.]
MMNENENRNEQLDEETEFRSVDDEEMTEVDELDDFGEEFPQRELSSVARLINTFIEPSKTMKDIIAKPTVLFPMIILFLVITFTAIITMGLAREVIIQTLTDAGQVPTETMINIAVYTGIGAAGIFGVLGILLVGLFVHGISLLMSGKATLKTTFSVIFHSSYISLAGALILSFVQYFTDNLFVTFSPAMLLAEDMFGSATYLFLASLDVFSIWYLVVAIIGISITHRISKLKASVPVLILSFVLIAITVIIAS